MCTYKYRHVEGYAYLVNLRYLANLSHFEPLRLILPWIARDERIVAKMVGMIIYWMMMDMIIYELFRGYDIQYTPLRNNHRLTNRYFKDIISRSLPFFSGLCKVYVRGYTPKSIWFDLLQYLLNSWFVGFEICWGYLIYLAFQIFWNLRYLLYPNVPNRRWLYSSIFSHHFLSRNWLMFLFRIQEFPLITGHFRNLNWRQLPFCFRPILQAYVRKYLHKMWP